MMKKFFTHLLIVLALITTAQLSNAQDVHFSQFFSAPLLLNPAMTGNVNGSYRASLTYRNQWSSIPAPFSTFAASFDASILGCELGNDHVGVGGAIFNDRAGDGALNNLTTLLSAAYHKGLDREGRYRLTAGVQAGFTQKSVDFTKLYFESQIENFEFNELLPNGEPIDRSSFHYFDFRAGGLFTAAVNENLSMYLGGAYYHLTKPEETFLLQSVLPDEAKNELDPRLVLHGGASIFLGEKISLSPSALFMTQTTNREIVLGTAFGYHFNQDSRYRRGGSQDNSALYLGGWYRWQDAVVLLVGLDFQGFRFGFSYDINISDLEIATLNQGAVELSLTFTGKMSECQKRQPLYCPRF